MYIQAIEKTESYDRQALKKSIDALFDALDINSELFEGIKVLIKPNLLSDSNPFFAVTTHPAVIEAVADRLLSCGVKNITLADSPGGALSRMRDFSYDEFYKKTGMAPLEEKLRLNKDGSWTCIKTENCKNKSFNILKAVQEADYIINIPKIKTHNLTTISFGIKNLFGCIPDIQKTAFHAKYPAMNDFSNMLIDLALAVKPSLTLADGIEIMEGNGPVYGSKRQLGLLFAAKDVFSQDYFIAELLGLDCKKIEMLNIAAGRGLIQKAQIVSTSVSPEQKFEPVALPEAKKSDNTAGKLKAFYNMSLLKLKKRLFKYEPAVREENCLLCGRCAESCPKNAIKLEKSAKISYESCICCFCCNEVCPADAVFIKKSFSLGRK